jgi:hypothetical protein
MKYKIKKSKIHGIGIISNDTIKINTTIGIVINYYLKFIPFRTTKIGHYLNHSFDNNCKLVYTKNKYYLVSIKNIKKDCELTINYNNTPWFIAGTWCL